MDTTRLKGKNILITGRPQGMGAQNAEAILRPRAPMSAWVM
jgi:NAD(P)-dependent dehydrogenase (short-subunit alcohol dehydrogenase family)